MYVTGFTAVSGVAMGALGYVVMPTVTWGLHIVAKIPLEELRGLCEIPTLNWVAVMMSTAVTFANWMVLDYGTDRLDKIPLKTRVAKICVAFVGAISYGFGVGGSPMTACGVMALSLVAAMVTDLYIAHRIAASKGIC